MREIGTVDRDNEVGPSFKSEIAGTAHACENSRNARHDFAQTHHRGRIERKQAFKPSAVMAAPPDANDAHTIARERLQSRHQLRAS
jgi:hypothetical protein